MPAQIFAYLQMLNFWRNAVGHYGAKSSMRILLAVTAIFLSSLLSHGDGFCASPWVPIAAAQEVPEAGGASGSDAEKAPDAGGKKEPVISPEQEELLGDMLGRGATLEGCTLGNGQIEHKIVNVVYTCPGGEVAVQLVHPSQAPNGATQTERFAITVRSGTPPEAFLPALASRIRSKEVAFEWTLVGDSTGVDAPVSVSWVRLGVVSLLGIGIVWLFLRRRGASKKA